MTAGIDDTQEGDSKLLIQARNHMCKGRCIFLPIDTESYPVVSIPFMYCKGMTTRENYYGVLLYNRTNNIRPYFFDLLAFMIHIFVFLYYEQGKILFFTVRANIENHQCIKSVEWMLEDEGNNNNIKYDSIVLSLKYTHTHSRIRNIFIFSRV
ncbi:hypothetical protein ACJX0J_017822 [Zea mays]